ncbi:VOC family protein [Kineococcus sp. SYSU DK018]|uniref:VOC family protein n=1 Tax=Kineococcus sp. SYSU DK018 TaxID=3383139 RepID=UPI003D7EC670
MTTTIASVFLPVHDTAAAADWYRERFELEVVQAGGHAAVLRDPDGRVLTLLGPASGISARPGLPWAPVSFRVQDLAGFRERCAAAGSPCSEVEGKEASCFFTTLRDPDGNTLLVVDR